jgi:endonuclease/exonuclease/phosphatase family metal-dependent hydrolase
MVAALSNERDYERTIGENQSLSRKGRKQAAVEARELEGADIVVLDEIDEGVKRSRYENVPRQLAKALHIELCIRSRIRGVEFDLSGNEKA